VLITDSSATTARQVVDAAGLLPPGTPTWLVANKMPPPGSVLDLEQVTAAMPRINGGYHLPADYHGRRRHRPDWAGHTAAGAPPWRSSQQCWTYR
jgi:hypothetical protein